MTTVTEVALLRIANALERIAKHLDGNDPEPVKDMAGRDVTHRRPS